jgi:hypothetical protein
MIDTTISFFKSLFCGLLLNCRFKYTSVPPPPSVFTILALSFPSSDYQVCIFELSFRCETDGEDCCDHCFIFGRESLASSVQRLETVKGQCHEMFYVRSFRDHRSPENFFCNNFNFFKHSQRCSTGVIDTGGHIFLSFSVIVVTTAINFPVVNSSVAELKYFFSSKYKLRLQLWLQVAL